MAIKLEFFDLILPIKTFKKKYPDGWELCLKDHDSEIGGFVWYLGEIGYLSQAHRVYCLTSHRVILHQKDIRFPRIGVPVESSVGVSRHIDVSRGVHRHSNAFVC